MEKIAKNKAKKILQKMPKKYAQMAVELVLGTHLYSEDRDFWIEVLNQINKN